jgi:integrase
MAGKRRGRGEGSIEEMPDGRFRAILSCGVDPTTGRRRRRKFYGKTKSEALAKLRQAQADHGRGQLAGAGRLTVGGWLEEWLGHVRDWSADRTGEFYERHVRRWLMPALGPVPLGKLTRRDVESANVRMKALGASDDARHKSLRTLNTALNAAADAGVIPANPAAKVKKPRVEKVEVRPYDADEVRRLLDAAAGHRQGAWFALAVDGGFRSGELFGLHWPDVDLDAGTVRVAYTLQQTKGGFKLKTPKTKKARRTVRLAPRTVRALEDHRQKMQAEGQDVERGVVFCSRPGRYYDRQTFRQEVYVPLLKRAGLRYLKPHGLRHTSATLLLSNGAGVKMVSERLGHESITITLKHYAHVLPNDQDQAVQLWGRILGDSPPDVPRNAKKPR